MESAGEGTLLRGPPNPPQGHEGQQNHRGTEGHTPRTQRRAARSRKEAWTGTPHRKVLWSISVKCPGALALRRIAQPLCRHTHAAGGETVSRGLGQWIVRTPSPPRSRRNGPRRRGVSSGWSGPEGAGTRASQYYDGHTVGKVAPPQQLSRVLRCSNGGSGTSCYKVAFPGSIRNRPGGMVGRAGPHRAEGSPRLG
jgi:hypothetical protein